MITEKKIHNDRPVKTASGSEKPQYVNITELQQLQLKAREKVRNYPRGYQGL